MARRAEPSLRGRAPGRGLDRRARGAGVEAAARRHLLLAGLHDIAANAQCRVGELDLVMRDGDCVVFVEVRYRGDSRHGGGTLSVGAAKQAKLTRAAAVYLQAHPQFAPMPCRFDVLACTGTPDAPQFEWTRAAFDAV